jgi:Rps23 Pro-64 3,4-dihydroxylase Tpa1-like proline 4-hydroxylase
VDIRDAIIQIDGLFNLELADKLVNYIDSAKLSKLGVGTSDKPDLDIRNVQGRFLINYNDSYKKNMSDFVFLQLINGEIFKILHTYIAKFPKLVLQKVVQCDLLKYSVGGKYEVHVDSFTHAHRELSCIINLNDNYKGGELSFFDNYSNKEILQCALKKGSVVFFPSNFMYPHKINPIKKGTRYSIVAWLA